MYATKKYSNDSGVTLVYLGSIQDMPLRCFEFNVYIQTVQSILYINATAWASYRGLPKEGTVLRII